MTDLQLDCLRIRTAEQLAEWSVTSFELPISASELPRVSVPRLLGERSVPDLDHLTTLIYHHVGKGGRCYAVALVHEWAMSRLVRTALNHPSGWRRSFGSGLPHDYGVAVSFGA